MYWNSDPAVNEKGTVLVLALIMLVVLAAIASGAATTSMLQQRMSTNALDQNVAFQAAETALRSGEGFLAAAGTPPPIGTANCSPAPCVATPYASLPWGVAGQTATVTTAAGVYANASSPPEVVIEDVGLYKTGQSLKKKNYQDGPVHQSEFYRVTARGSGLTATSQAMVRSYYALKRQ